MNKIKSWIVNLFFEDGKSCTKKADLKLSQLLFLIKKHRDMEEIF